jgi:hypothetical protein
VINLEHIVETVLQENANVAGGTGSVLGAGVVTTETPFSGDNYAKGDARIPKVLGGIARRAFPKDSLYSGKTRRKHRRKHKRRR